MGQRKWFTGSGWFGQPARTDGGALRAESLWGDCASSRADALHLGREDRHGTSILIVGFRDPTSEQIDEVPQLVRRIRRAATKFFWPAMVMDMRHLRLSVGDEQDQELVAVDADRAVTPFVDCYRHREDATESLEHPGDVAIRRIPVELPRRRGGASGVPGHVDLVVRLASATRRDPLLNHVALFRGPGMVVRYWDRTSLATGIRPFHAILVCGTARNPRKPSGADQEIERFLRAAEPPGHDDWLATPRLKQSYQRGYAKALKTLKDRVSAELRKLLISKPSQGEKGPERLQRRFPIGARGGGGGEQSAFRFAGLQAHFDGSRWHVAGQIELVQRGLPWHARLSLSELGDDGHPVDPIAVESLAVECDDARVELVLVLRCADTRLRRAIQPTRGRLRSGTFTARIELHRTELFGTAELHANLVRSDPCLHRQPGFAWAAGARLASTRPWELRFERKRPPAGRFLDVRYRSFSEDEVLTPFRKNLYRLELDQDAPILWVNTDHDKLTPILSDKGSTGKRARLREVFYDVIAHGVWAQLFVRAAEDIRAQGELTYDWEDAVLIELLPMILPGHRGHTARVAALRRTLRRDGLAVVMDRFDAALQHRSELTRHMTRLVEETVEARS